LLTMSTWMCLIIPTEKKKLIFFQEDEILTKMVTKHGLKNWQTIASAIPSRNAQQCRIR
jgi:hypothetical protein